MPAFHEFDDVQVRELVTYVHALQGTGTATALPGDPLQGEKLFFGTARCSTCHMAEGKGGFIASDLTGYAGIHSPGEILHNIQSPRSDREGGNKLATVTTRTGQQFRGVVRNRDNFSLQLQDLDGTFHLFTMSDVLRVEYAAKSLMPGDYGSVLPRKALDDIVSFLMRISAAHPQAKQPSQANE